MYRRLSNLRKASSSSRLAPVERLLNRVIRRLDNLRYIFGGLNDAIRQIVVVPNSGLARADCADAQFGRARSGSVSGKSALHEIRISNPDARRPEALHLGLRSERHVAEISDSDAAHAIQRRALRARQLPLRARPITDVYGRGLHLRLSGRA